MKRLVLALFLAIIAGSTFAQDVIIKNDGSTVLCKVQEISNSEIKYKKWSNLDGPVYRLSVTDVTRINFENGEVELFENKQSLSDVNSTILYDDSNYDNPNYIDGELKLSGNKVYIEDQQLSDAELRQLLGKEWYIQFATGRKMAIAGSTCIALGTLFVIGGFISYGINPRNSTNVIIAITAGGIGLPFYITGLAIPKRIHKNTIDEYNKFNNAHKTKTANVQITPSIISGHPSNNQAQVGLGMTVSLDF